MNTIKTWQERCSTDPTFPSSDKAMQAEIAELRAALSARATPAQPVPHIIRDAIEATFEQRQGYMTKIAAAVRALHDQPSPSSVGAAITDQKITDLADDNDCGRTAKGYRLFSDRNLMAFSRALLSEAAALAEQVQGQQWLPIESAPKDGTEVFLWLQAPFNRIEKARWFDLWENWQLGEFPDAMDEYCGIGSKVPTHYMPIPAAPSIAQDGQKSESV